MYSVVGAKDHNLSTPGLLCPEAFSLNTVKNMVFSKVQLYLH
jgi:hypothetical protein